MMVPFDRPMMRKSSSGLLLVVVFLKSLSDSSLLKSPSWLAFVIVTFFLLLNIFSNLCASLKISQSTLGGVIVPNVNAVML